MLHEVLILKKGANTKLGEHLDQSELDCKCDFDICTHTIIADDLIRRFYQLRDELEIPLHINSGYRCILHNADSRGQKQSKHTLGHAMDIACPNSMSIQQFWLLALKYFDVVVPYIDDNFIHCQINFDKE